HDPPLQAEQVLYSPVESFGFVVLIELDWREFDPGEVQLRERVRDDQRRIFVHRCHVQARHDVNDFGVVPGTLYYGGPDRKTADLMVDCPDCPADHRHVCSLPVPRVTKVKRPSCGTSYMVRPRRPKGRRVA